MTTACCGDLAIRRSRTNQCPLARTGRVSLSVQPSSAGPFVCGARRATAAIRPAALARRRDEDHVTEPATLSPLARPSASGPFRGLRVRPPRGGPADRCSNVAKLETIRPRRANGACASTSQSASPWRLRARASPSAKSVLYLLFIVLAQRAVRPSLRATARCPLTTYLSEAHARRARERRPHRRGSLAGANPASARSRAAAADFSLHDLNATSWTFRSAAKGAASALPPCRRGLARGSRAHYRRRAFWLDGCCCSGPRAALAASPSVVGIIPKHKQ